jgi:hypothetical protein
MLPQRGGPSPALKGAALRDRRGLERALAEWKERTAAARMHRDATPEDPPAAFAFSRAFERTRGIAWVLSSLDFVENVHPNA